MGNYLDAANDPWMWLMCAPIVLMTVFQAFIFTKKAFNASDVGAVNLTRKQCIQAFRTGMISAVGPAVAVFIVMLGLMSVIGGPMSWFRLSVIGAAPTELTAATIGGQAMGVEFGSAEYGLTAFSASVWTMTLNGIGWLLFCGLFTHRLGVIKDKVAGGDVNLLTEIAGAAVLGTAGYLLTGHLIAGGARMISGIVAAIVMAILIKLSDRIPRLKEYNLGIAMVIGMAVGVLV